MTTTVGFKFQNDVSNPVHILVRAGEIGVGPQSCAQRKKNINWIYS